MAAKGVKAKVAGKTRIILLKDLEPDPRNPNRRDEVDSLKASLEEFGQHRPAVVYLRPRKKKFTIAIGNHLYLAAVELGWSELQCMVVDEDEAKAVRRGLVDNRVGEQRYFDDQALHELLASAGSDLPGFDKAFLEGLDMRLGLASGNGQEYGANTADGLGLKAKFIIVIESGRASEIRDRLKEIVAECEAVMTEDIVV